MAFFNKIKKIFTGDSQAKSEENNKKSVGDKAIEKSLMGVKKYYEFKIKLVNQVTEINPEWDFYDQVTQERSIKEFKQKANDIQGEIDNIKQSIYNCKNKIDSLKFTYNNNAQRIINYEKVLVNNEENENEDLEKKVESLKRENIGIKQEIYSNELSLQNFEEGLDSLNNKSLDLNFLIITELAFVEGKYEECKAIAEKHCIVNNFTSIALESMKQYETGNIELAKDYAEKYFIAEEANESTIHNPTLDRLYSKILIEQEKYNEAKVFLDYVVQYYPDDVDIHKMLKQVHINLGEEKEAKLEEKIIELLM